MADLTWSPEEWRWLSKRNRSILQQTPEGRAELQQLENAPLLMDGRKDRITGEQGADRLNRAKLMQESARSQKPIAVLTALHDRPNTEDGRRMMVEKMDAEDFRGIEQELMVCVGARVLLTQNLWVEAGLINGALGVVKGFMWPQGADPYSERQEERGQAEQTLDTRDLDRHR